MANVLVSRLLEYYEMICQKDTDCIALKEYLLLAFSHNPDRFRWEEHESITRLVYEICQRISPNAVYAVWVICCQTILSYWAGNMVHFEPGHDLLRYLLQCWQVYQKGVNVIYGLTIYAHSVVFRIVKHQFVDIGIHLFVENFLAVQHKDNLFVSILGMMDKLKTFPEPDSAEMTTLKLVFKLFIYMESQNHTLFYKMFSFQYLKALKNNYQARSKKLINTNVSDYLRFAELVIKKEMSIANKCSFPGPMLRMQAKTLYTVLISQYRSRLCNYDHFRTIVESKQWPELFYLYRMLKYDPAMVKDMAGNLERLIKSQLEAIQVPDWNGGGNLYRKPQVNQFTLQCSALLRNWTKVVIENFNNDSTIFKSLINSFRWYLNSQPAFVCIISIYVHFILMMDHCSQQQEQEEPRLTRKDLVQNAYDLLSFIEKKSSVSHYNRRFLCQRIMSGVTYSVTEDIELTAEMFESIKCNDITTNVRLLIGDFQKATKECTAMEHPMDVLLLNASLWTFNGDVETVFRIPQQFLSQFDSYKAFFEKKQKSLGHTKRNLALKHDYSSAMMAACFCNGTETINFRVTLQQATVLLLFNDRPRYNYGQLAELTGMDHECLRRILALFHRYRLIIIRNADDETGQQQQQQQPVPENWNLNDDCWFEIDDRFSAARCLVKNDEINWIKLQYLHADYDIAKMVAEVERRSRNNQQQQPRQQQQQQQQRNSQQQQQHQSAEANGELDGSFWLEAAIVRVMKCCIAVADIRTLQNKVQLSLRQQNRGRNNHNHNRNNYCFSTTILDDLAEFRKIVDSLERQHYIRQLPDGRIVYEP